MEKTNRLAVTGVAIADCLGDDGIENNFNRYMANDTSKPMDIENILSLIHI